MRSWALRLGVGAFLAISACSAASAAATPPRQAGVIVIKNVNLVTLDSRGVMEGASLVSRYGKIDAILGKGEALPSASQVIDGSGKYLIPGLIDAHIHFDGEPQLASYLRYGVTTVFSLGTQDSGMPRMLEVLARQRRGAFVGAHLYATGPIVPQQRDIKTPQEVGPFLDYLQQNRLPFVKVYNKVTQPVFDEAVRQAKARNMGVFGHIPRGFPAEYTLSHGINVVAHMEEFFLAPFTATVTDSALPNLKPDWSPDYALGFKLIDLAKANHVAIIPDLVASYNFRALWADQDRELGVDDSKYLGAEAIDEWRKYNYSQRPMQRERQIREEIKYPYIRALTYRAQQQGVRLLTGTDAPLPAIYPGRSLHQELRLLVSAGLTNEQALRAATINGGDVAKRLIDHDTCIGQIATGCEADLVLLDANPLDDIRNSAAIAGVMVDGHYLTRTQLDLLRERAAGLAPKR